MTATFPDFQSKWPFQVGAEKTPHVTEQLTPRNWRKIALGTFQNSDLQCGQVSKDADGWHIIEIGPFDLQSAADLEFQFVDTANPSWKAGMKWDYVELKKIPQGNL